MYTSEIVQVAICSLFYQKSNTIERLQPSLCASYGPEKSSSDRRASSVRTRTLKLSASIFIIHTKNSINFNILHAFSIEEIVEDVFDLFLFRVVSKTWLTAQCHWCRVVASCEKCICTHKSNCARRGSDELESGIFYEKEEEALILSVFHSAMRCRQTTLFAVATANVNFHFTKSGMSMFVMQWQRRENLINIKSDCSGRQMLVGFMQ